MFEKEKKEEIKMEENSIEIQANLSASGKVSLLGTGIEIGGSGGIKFVLKKKPTG
jgi:hypothetical protein